MGNPYRLDEPGSFHHVFSRAVDGRAIFVDPSDRVDLEDRIARQVVAGAFHVHACTVMSNHFHLLLERLEIPLSDSMHRILTGFAVQHNVRHERRGHVFQSRFRSIRVEDGDYLYELIRYIHLNPLRAGIVPDLEALEEYVGSSHAHIMGRRQMNWICTELLERLFGEIDPGCWQRNYLEFLARESSCSLKELRVGSHLLDRMGIRATRDEDVKWRPGQARILGSMEYVRKVYEARAGKRGFHVRSREAEHQQMNAITVAVSSCTCVPVTSLRKSGRSGRLCRARRVLIRMLVEEIGVSSSNVARYLGISVTAVTKSLRTDLDAQDVITIRAIKEYNKFR
jgi:putative transposase